MADTIERLLYSRKDAAKALSISLRSIDYLVSNKKLKTRPARLPRPYPQIRTPRTVDLNMDTVAAIESLRRKGQKGSDLVFSRQGPRFDTRSWFVPCLQKAGIEGYVWHSNRHTSCSWLAMAGATIKEIQNWPGIRRLPCLPATVISHPTTNSRSSTESPLSGDCGATESQELGSVGMSKHKKLLPDCPVIHAQRTEKEPCLSFP
jgi:hypothetical protein